MREQNNASGEEVSKGRFHSELFDWGEALLISLAAVILVFVFGVRIIGVEGNSMLPTLQDGNQLLVSNLFYTPEKGDVVILTKDSFMVSPIVKRVIATEGDTVDIDFSTGTVSVNGEVLEESYIAEPTTTQYDVTFPQTVPEGCIFVMGDIKRVLHLTCRVIEGHIQRIKIVKLVFHRRPFDHIKSHLTKNGYNFLINF